MQFRGSGFDIRIAHGFGRSAGNDFQAGDSSKRAAQLLGNAI